MIHHQELKLVATGTLKKRTFPPSMSHFQALFPQVCRSKRAFFPQVCRAFEPESPKYVAVKKPFSPEYVVLLQASIPRVCRAFEPESPKYVAAKKPFSPKYVVGSPQSRVEALLAGFFPLEPLSGLTYYRKSPKYVVPAQAVIPQVCRGYIDRLDMECPLYLSPCGWAGADLSAL